MTSSAAQSSTSGTAADPTTCPFQLPSVSGVSLMVTANLINGSKSWDGHTYHVTALIGETANHGSSSQLELHLIVVAEQVHNSHLVPSTQMIITEMRHAVGSRTEIVGPTVAAEFMRPGIRPKKRDRREIHEQLTEAIACRLPLPFADLD